jgi:hypothetical protein
MGGYRQNRRLIQFDSFNEFHYNAPNHKEIHNFKELHYKEIRELLKLTSEEIISNTNIFLSVKNPLELCKLLHLDVNEIYQIYNPSYESFTIIKKGKDRKINSPCYSLRFTQKRLLLYLGCVYKNFYLKEDANYSNPSYAYIPSTANLNNNRNILTNAKNHIGKKIVVNIDLENFFPSISEIKVLELFTNYPFHFNEELALFITKIVTFENTLPVGASTSPIISNFVANSLDEELKNISYLTYTRYSDDLTFSSSHYNKQEFHSLIKLIKSVIENHGFKLNKNKFKISLSTDRQEVTGIVVNEKANVRRTYIREIRAIIHSVLKYGENHAAKKYAQKFVKQFIRAARGYYRMRFNYHLSDEIILNHLDDRFYNHFFYYSLRSKIGHIGYVKGKNDLIYKDLKEKIDFFSPSIDTRRLIEPINLIKSDRIVYVTNATANSIVYYAYAFLKKSIYSDITIMELRKRFSNFGNIAYEKLMNDFKNQSAYFLNIYAYMNENDRFEEFANNLENQGNFNKIFKFDSNSFALLKQYNRKIFHLNSKCENITSNYDEDGEYFLNTGVFYKDIIEKEDDKKKPLYVVSKDFLQFLGMRFCKVCGEGIN